MILKAVYPSKLGNEEFANYLKVTKGQSANSNTNLINEYVHDKNPWGNKSDPKTQQSVTELLI